MHVYYKFGLFWIFLIGSSLRCLHAAPPAATAATVATTQSAMPTEADDYYDESYDDADYNDTISTTTATASPSTTTLTTTTLHTVMRSNHVLEPSCPQFCLCLADYKYVQCTNKELKHVPADMPRTALIIDLSHNQIGALRDSDFVNYTKVREINLSDNHLTAVNKQAFMDLTHLHSLNLAGNRLTDIAADAFSGASELSKLDLSNNTIRLNAEGDGGAWLQQPNLLEFACQNCSWTQLHDDTFAHMGNLKALKLDQNDFDMKINTKAFTPVSKSLLKLQLPELEATSIQELCKILTAIDNISFKYFNVSCYAYVLGTPYNESIIYATDPISGNRTLPSEQSQITNDTTNTQIHRGKMANATNVELNLLPPDDGDVGVGSNVTRDVLNAGIMVTVSPTGNTEQGVKKPYQVPVSRETINIMLISIMVIATIGIIIGLICRKDVCGIKTKCCRTRKPEAKDQVHPAEEIPLNKLA